jgi:hypothetical protein
VVIGLFALQHLTRPAPQPADPREVDTSNWSRADREKWQRAHA